MSAVTKARMSTFECPVRARNTAPATAFAPRMPSGWLCVTAALRSASASTSASVSNAYATGLTRMAEPLPHELYGSVFLYPAHWMNVPPNPASG